MSGTNAPTGVHGPPNWSPPDGREIYLPEQVYFRVHGGVPMDLAMRRTAQAISRWADRFIAYPMTGPREQRAGSLPMGVSERGAMIDSLCDWLEETPEWYMRALNLFAGEVPLMEQHDGMPGLLVLNQKQFSDLQDAWGHSGLPQDLYYPASEQRVVVEPVEIEGALVRTYQRYTPLLWKQRDTDLIESLQVPSEEERRRAFADAGRLFQGALRRRMAELAEPGREQDRENIQILGRLIRDTLVATRRVG